MDKGNLAEVDKGQLDNKGAESDDSIELPSMAELYNENLSIDLDKLLSIDIDENNRTNLEDNPDSSTIKQTTGTAEVSTSIESETSRKQRKELSLKKKDEDEGIESDMDLDSENKQGQNSGDAEDVHDYLVAGKGSQLSRVKSRIEKIEDLLTELKAEADVVHLVFQNGEIDDINLVFAYQLADFSKSLEKHTEEFGNIAENLLLLDDMQTLAKGDTESEVIKFQGKRKKNDTSAKEQDEPTRKNNDTSAKGQDEQSNMFESEGKKEKRRKERKRKLYLKVAKTGHKRVAKELAKFSCGVCFRKYTSEQNLRSHMGRHLDYTYQCTICDKRLRSLSGLQVHKLSHQKGTFKCKKCGKKFERLSSLKNHSQTHNEFKLKCPKPNCTREYKFKHKLREHIDEWHDTERKIKCPECPKVYQTSNNMYNHKKRKHSAGAKQK